MNSFQAPSRLLDKNHRPSEEEIRLAAGEEAYAAWNDIKQYLDRHYDFTPELIFGGANYGWTVRYRKSGKTLCALYPEQGAFTILVILGKEEVKKVMLLAEELSEDMMTVITDTEQLHDGRWLWLRVYSVSQINDIKVLLKAKRKPKNL